MVSQDDQELIKTSLRRGFFMARLYGSPPRSQVEAAPDTVKSPITLGSPDQSNHAHRIQLRAVALDLLKYQRRYPHHVRPEHRDSPGGHTLGKNGDENLPSVLTLHRESLVVVLPVILELAFLPSAEQHSSHHRQLSLCQLNADLLLPVVCLRTRGRCCIERDGWCAGFGAVGVEGVMPR